MATLDASVYYSICLGSILVIILALPYLHLRRLSSNLLSTLQSSTAKRLGEVESFDNDSRLLDDLNSVPIQTYPQTWWTDEKIFKLERRAIFSKTWLFATHTSRFQKPGDYRTFDIAGFSFILTLGKDNQLRAFHNICRHRAYAVTKKVSGSSTVLGCRYHGWSYDTKGKLIKAPEFENVKGFDKDLNSLWEVKTEIRESMVFVNFDVGNEVTSQVLGEVETQIKSWKLGEMNWIAEWKFEGRFNWKLAAATLSHNPCKQTWFPLPQFGRVVETRSIFHTTIFRRLRSGQLLTFRLLPLTKATTGVECNLYAARSKNTTADQNRIATVRKGVQLEIKQVEVLQLELLDGMGMLSSSSDFGLLNRLNEVVEQHVIAERKLGVEIHPAARNQSFSQEGREDDDLCKELDKRLVKHESFCSATAKGLLDW